MNTTAVAIEPARADPGGADFAGPDSAASRMALLLESTGEGIFGVDNAGRCTFINRAGAEILGWRIEDVLGRNMHGLIHHSHANGGHYPESECPIVNAFRSGPACRIDREVLWRADGSAFSAEYSSHPVIDAGKVISWERPPTSANTRAKCNGYSI